MIRSASAKTARPTSQSSTLSSLRAIPHLTVIRPGDANEAVEAWRTTMTHTHGPMLLALSRQKVPTLDRTKLAPASGARRGGYVIAETAGKSRGHHFARLGIGIAAGRGGESET